MELINPDWTAEQRLQAKAIVDKYIAKIESVQKMEAHVEAINHIADSHAPQLSGAFKKNVRALQHSADKETLIGAMKRNDTSAVIGAFDFGKFQENMSNDLKTITASTLTSGAEFTGDQLKAGVHRRVNKSEIVNKAPVGRLETTYVATPERIGAIPTAAIPADFNSFNAVNEFAIDLKAQQRTEEIMSGLTDIEDPQGISQVIAGLNATLLNPTQAEELLRGVIGLNNQQQGWLANYTNDLMSQGVTSDEMMSLLSAKEQDYLFQRADMIARTESNRNANDGRELAYQEADSQGLLPGNWREVWDANDDACEECLALDGQTTEIGGDWDGERPGSIHPGDRCSFHIEEVTP